MPAALIASMLKIAFAAQSDHACDPAPYCPDLNQALCGKFQGHYVTAAYVSDRYRETHGMLCGRRPPPTALERTVIGKRRRSFWKTDYFWDTFPIATYSEVEVSFREGDWLVLYTDGIPEMTGQSEEQFGEARLKLFLENHTGSQAADLVDGLLDTMSQWSDRRPTRSPMMM